MASALDALWQKVIAAVHPTVVAHPSAPIHAAAAASAPHYPIYSENRRTHAPQVTRAPQPGDATGQEYPTPGITAGDRAQLFMSGIQNGVGADMTKYLLTDAGRQGGPIYTTPSSDNPEQNTPVLRHETIHSVLDSNGIGKKQLDKFMADNPQLTPVQHAFDASRAAGDASTELPAYMAQPSPYYTPDPAHKAAYTKAFLPWLQSQAPKAAAQYATLMDQ